MAPMLGKTLSTATAVAIGVVFFSSQNATGTASTGYQINAAHDGTATASGKLVPPLSVKWTRDLGAYVSYPMVARDLVFVTVGNASICNPPSQLIALDIATGNTVWQRDVDGRYCYTNAAYDSGRIFDLNATGVLRSYSGDNRGKLLWTVQLPIQTSFFTPPTAGDGHVVLAGGGSGGTLYSVNDLDGSVNWTAHIDGDGETNPAIGDGGVYASLPCQAYRFDEQTGALNWRDNHGCDGGGGTTPVYFGKRVYPLDPNSNLDVLQSQKGTVIGHLGGDQPPSFWKGGHKIYEIILQAGVLKSIDQKSTARQWSFTGDGALSSAPIVVDSTIFIASSKNKIFAVDAATGVQVWSGDLPAPFSQAYDGPITGLGVGLGTLLVPTGTKITAFSQP